MTKAVFFINPLSNGVKKRGSVLMKAALGTDIKCHELHNFETLSKSVKLAAKNNVQTVCVEGGDGTIHGVLSAFLKFESLFEKFPHFILLPGGMTNLVAKHVGVKKPTPVKVLALIKDAKISTCTELPLIKIQTQDDIHSGFFFSTGALPKATHLCFDKIYTQGITGAAAVRTTLLRVLFGKGEERDLILSPSPFSLECDTVSIQGEHIVTIATTLPGLMIGLKPYWGEKNGAIRITHIRSGSQNLVRNVMRMLRAKQTKSSAAKLEEDGFTSWSTNKAHLRYDGPMVLDGEFLPQTNTPMTLSVSRPLMFLK